MSDDELRRIFESVLTAPPPDTADIDVAIRMGRRRRHRRAGAVVLSSAVAVAAVVAAVFTLPGLQRQPGNPAASSAATSASVTADDGTIVTDGRQLLGSWMTIELDGHNVRAARDDSKRPLTVKFDQRGTQLWWGANDTMNAHSGTLSVAKDGRFLANKGTVTLVGTTNGKTRYLRNPEAVEQATEARIMAATPTSPPRLLLLTAGELVAVYARTDQ